MLDLLNIKLDILALINADSVLNVCGFLGGLSEYNISVTGHCLKSCYAKNVQWVS